MKNIKTFEGFFDFLKPSPKPEIPFKEISEDFIRERVTLALTPLASDSDFLMSVQKHETFHTEGIVGNIKYNVGIFKTSFYAGREDARDIKATVANNVRKFEYYVPDETPTDDRIAADSLVQGRVNKMVSRILKDPQIRAQVEQKGRLITNGIVELGFKFTFLLTSSSTLDNIPGM